MQSKLQSYKANSKGDKQHTLGCSFCLQWILSLFDEIFKHLCHVESLQKLQKFEERLRKRAHSRISAEVGLNKEQNIIDIYIPAAIKQPVIIMLTTTFHLMYMSTSN